MKISATVTLKKDVLDPQGKVVNQTLKNMGYDNITNVRQGKFFEIELKETDKEASDLIQKQIDDWPDVLDSKPKNFKMPPQPGYRFREGEKWVKIGADGEMEFEDIEIKE